MRFKNISAVYLVLIKENKILLSKRQNTGFEDNKYSLPAGHIEQNESAIQAVIRESKEELNIDISENDLNFVHLMHRKSNEERMDLFFECYDWNGVIHNNEPDKCNELIWCDIINIPSNTIDYIKMFISKYNDNLYYSEYNWK